METVIGEAPGKDLVGVRFGVTVSQTGFTFDVLNVPSQIGGTLVEGGADITSAFLQTLVLALVAPEYKPGRPWQMIRVHRRVSNPTQIV